MLGFLLSGLGRFTAFWLFRELTTVLFPPLFPPVLALAFSRLPQVSKCPSVFFFFFRPVVPPNPFSLGDLRRARNFFQTFLQAFFFFFSPPAFPSSLDTFLLSEVPWQATDNRQTALTSLQGKHSLSLFSFSFSSPFLALSNEHQKTLMDTHRHHINFTSSPFPPSCVPLFP